jgi:hypothetical protein
MTSSFSGRLLYGVMFFQQYVRKTLPCTDQLILCLRDVESSEMVIDLFNIVKYSKGKMWKVKCM